MPNTSKKNTRGRPRILNKETIINIAFDEYWINGISEVPLSSIAKIAKVSRPGIYKEFNDEDGLKSEVLQKYIKALDTTVIPTYENSDHPEIVYAHFHNIIYSATSDNFKGFSSNTTGAKRPKNAKGCLFEKSRLTRNKLGKKSLKTLNNWEEKRRKVFASYISRGIKNGYVYKNIDAYNCSMYIDSQLKLAQLLQQDGIKNNKIKNLVNTSLSTIFREKYRS